jgi:hypothetical protein
MARWKPRTSWPRSRTPKRRYEQFPTYLGKVAGAKKKLISLRLSENQIRVLNEISRSVKLSKTDIVRSALMEHLYRKFGVPKSIWYER